MRRNSLRVNCVTARNQGVAVRQVRSLCGLPYSLQVPIRPTWAVTSLVGLLRRRERCPLILLTHHTFVEGCSFSLHTLRLQTPSDPILRALICCESSPAARTTRQTGETPNNIPRLVVGHQPWYNPPTPATTTLQTLTECMCRR